MAGRFLKAALAILLVCSASSASAAFSSIVVFGDGLSDNGNFYAAAGAPPVPYFKGRASNGPVAVEVMASNLGLPLTDYAWNGAKTGLDNVQAASMPGTLKTVQVVTASATFSPSDLIVLWAGPNDIFEAAATPGVDWGAVVGTAVTNLAASVDLLYGKGARTILVPNMANLGSTPAGLGSGDAALLGTVTSSFNTALASTIVSLETNLAGLDIVEFDAFGRMNALLANPAAFGLTNVTEPCLVGGTVCGNPDTYLFWDDVHPTARGHTLLGGAFAEAVRATGTVPEPSLLALVACGLTVVFATCHRRRRGR